MIPTLMPVPRALVTVFGSNGEFVVDAETGEVITRADEMPLEYAWILHVDLVEYTRYWGEPVAGHIDVLDLDCYALGGDKVPAEDDHRRLVDRRRGATLGG